MSNGHGGTEERCKRGNTWPMNKKRMVSSSVIHPWAEMLRDLLSRRSITLSLSYHYHHLATFLTVSA